MSLLLPESTSRTKKSSMETLKSSYFLYLSLYLVRRLMHAQYFSICRAPDGNKAFVIYWRDPGGCCCCDTAGRIASWNAWCSWMLRYSLPSFSHECSDPRPVWALHHPTWPWEQLQPQLWLVLDGHWLYSVYDSSLDRESISRACSDTLLNSQRESRCPFVNTNQLLTSRNSFQWD